MDDPFESNFRDEKAKDVHNLLEEGWFYRKPLNTKPPTILRCYSDPSPNLDQQNPPKSSSAKKSSSTMKGVNERKCQGVRKLTRQLSDLSLATKPTSYNQEEKVESHLNEEKGSNKIIGQPSSHLNEEKGSNKIIGQPSLVGLRRAPSLPVYFGREEESEDDEGDDISMSRLILQAMPSSSCGSYARRTSKGIKQSSTMPKNQPPRSSTTVDTTDRIRTKEVKNRSPDHRKLKKTLSNLDYQEVQGFKDLGFSFTREELNPRIAELLPCFEGKGKIGPDQYNKLESPDLPEAWHPHTSATPIPISAGKNSAEDIKAQLKFWARAVASNVR